MYRPRIRSTMIAGLGLVFGPAAVDAGDWKAVIFNGAQTGAPRVCSVAVQDRSGGRQAISGLDGMLTIALRAVALEAVTIPFEPPAAVDQTARLAGCGYLLYTDLVRAEETPGSRFARHVRTIFASNPAAGPSALRAEIEFRLYRIDEDGPPILSTAVAGKSRVNRPQEPAAPAISMRLVPGTAVSTSEYAPDSLANASDILSTHALDIAFAREAAALAAALGR